MQEKLSFSGGRSHTVLDKQRGRAETYAMCKERRAQRFVGLAVDLGWLWDGRGVKQNQPSGTQVVRDAGRPPVSRH